MGTRDTNKQWEVYGKGLGNLNRQPQIKTCEIKLAGIQVIIQEGSDLSEVLSGIYARLFYRLKDIQNINVARRTFGYWHFIDNYTKLYFAGIQVDTFDNFKWDYTYGLVAWSLGKSTWTIWQEKDGNEGSIVHGNVCWDWLNESSYQYDNRFIGDFEVREWLELGGDTKGKVHEIWIPIENKI